MLIYERIDAPPLRMSDAYDHEEDPALAGAPMPKSDSEPEAHDRMTTDEKAAREKEFASQTYEANDTIRLEVMRSNVQFQHYRTVYCEEYFGFFLQLLQGNTAFIAAAHAAASAQPEQLQLQAAAEALNPFSASLLHAFVDFLLKLALRCDDHLRPDLEDWPELGRTLFSIAPGGADWFFDMLEMAEGTMVADMLFLNPVEDAREVSPRPPLCWRDGQTWGWLTRAEQIGARRALLCPSNERRPRRGAW
jgi:hypothetical protein